LPSARWRWPPGHNLAVVAQHELSESANFLSFFAKRERPRLLRHMRSSTVTIGGRRPSGPALESMIEGGGPFIPKQPRNLSERHTRILQILSREALPQLVDDLAVCRAFFSQSSREGAQAEGQSLRHIFSAFAFPCGSSFSASASTAERSVPSCTFRSVAAASQYGRRTRSSFGSAVISGRRRASAERRNTVFGAPNSTGQPKNRSNSRTSEFRLCANATFAGTSLRPDIVRNAAAMAATTYSILCREAYLGRPADSDEAARL
jgi:hypothetical protein